MQWSAIITVFATIFVAELGDKTQLATILYASNPDVNKWGIFLGAALALILTSALGVVAGSWLGEQLNESTLRIVAGSGFIAVGIWTLIST